MREFERETNDDNRFELVVIERVTTVIGRHFDEIRLVTIAFVGSVSIHFQREFLAYEDAEEVRLGEVQNQRKRLDLIT